MFLLFIPQVIAFLDFHKIKYAVDAGSQYYYKDKNKILYKYDQGYEGGEANQIQIKYNQDQKNYLIPMQYLDFKIYSSERITTDTFSYMITLRMFDNYTLLFAFVETEHRQQNKRLFDIYFEDIFIRKGIDIIKESGGFAIPVLYPIEFQLQENSLIIDDQVKKIEEGQLQFKITFKGYGAKVNAILVYQGQIKDIIQDLETALQAKEQIETIHPNQVEFIKAVKLKGFKYSKKGRTKQDYYGLLNSYLAPFQCILNQIDIGQADQQIEIHTAELILESLLQFIIIPFGNLLYLIFEFIFNNKLFIFGIFIHFITIMMCMGTRGQRTNSNELCFYSNLLKQFNEYEVQSPRQRAIQKVKSKKKK